MTRAVVIKVSGSEITPANPEFVKRLSASLKSLYRDGKYDIALVPGGGHLARDYIRSARDFGAGEAQSDLIGVEATRLNATFLIACLRDLAYPTAIEDPREASHLVLQDHVIGVICGRGTGHSTDNVAAQFAGVMGVKQMVKITSVGGIYSKDPRTNPDAKMLKAISYDDLKGLISHDSRKAGSNMIVDMLCAKSIQNNHIEMFVISPNDVGKIGAVLEHRSDLGTVVNAAGERDIRKQGELWPTGS